MISDGSQLFDSTLFDLIEDYLCTCDDTFEFKSKHSSNVSIYTLQYHQDTSSPLYSCFFAGPKAFERVVKQFNIYKSHNVIENICISYR